MKVLVWNIRHGGGRRIPEIVAAICSHVPDVLVLCEFRAAPGEELCRLLSARGFSHARATPLRPRQNGVAIVSRWPLLASSKARPSAVPKHRWLEVDVPDLAVTVAGFYGPLENHRYDEWWRSVRRAVASRIEMPFLIAGDFNTGMSVVDAPRTQFYCANHFMALQKLGLVDVWRDANRESAERSWYSRRGGKDMNGFRLDHLLASPSLAVRATSARYSHVERTDSRISDHSILLAEFRDTAAPLS